MASCTASSARLRWAGPKEAREVRDYAARLAAEEVIQQLRALCAPRSWTLEQTAGPRWCRRTPGADGRAREPDRFVVIRPLRSDRSRPDLFGLAVRPVGGAGLPP